MNVLEIGPAFERLKPGVGHTYSIDDDVMSITMHDGSTVTQAEIEADIAENGGFIEIRIQRSSLLSQSDWRLAPDSPLSDGDKEKWVAYRKKLRDLPATNSDPTKIVFPDAP